MVSVIICQRRLKRHWCPLAVVGVVTVFVMYHFSKLDDTSCHGDFCQLKKQNARLIWEEFNKLPDNIVREQQRQHFDQESHWQDHMKQKQNNMKRGQVNVAIKKGKAYKNCLVYDLKQPLDEEFQCVPLEVLDIKTKICIYDKKDDRYVSGQLKSDHIYEPQLMMHFQTMLKQDPDLHFIDIGANLGVWALVAAKMHRKVVAVEPVPSNYRRFHKAILLEKFQDKVTLVLNPVSDKHENVVFKFVPGNMGGTMVKSVDMSVFNNTEPTARTITLEDLTEVCDFKKAFLKLDIEGDELKALRTSDKLFQKINIPLISMEWEIVKQQKKKLLDEFIKSMHKKGYIPFADGLSVSGYQLGLLNTDTRWNKTTQVLWAHLSYIYKYMPHVMKVET